MDRKRRISGIVLIVTGIMYLCSCDIPTMETALCHIDICCGDYMTKASDPDENLISDVSIMIFDETGEAEECIWIPDVRTHHEVTLVKGKRYSLRACANFGYHVYADHIEELEELTYYMTYPDEYSDGIPMYAEEEFMLTGDMSLRLKFKRLMSKISLMMDRSRMDENVEMNVRTVRIGNCPKSVKVFGKSAISSSDQCFAAGFSKADYQTDMLNSVLVDGRSGPVSLYMLENMQGAFPDKITEDKDKVFGKDDHRKELCSYIEMEMDYVSPASHSSTGPLIYRFYLGDGINNLDVERNCHYRITVSPEGDGLSDEGWRVDKSGLKYTGATYFKAMPDSYLRGDIGDRIHIWCEFSPAYASFDIGREYMEEDRSNGIYDYEIDPDGHGAVLTLKGAGRGLIYMEAGAPVNDAALFIIEVNQPA